MGTIQLSSNIQGSATVNGLTTLVSQAGSVVSLITSSILYSTTQSLVPGAGWTALQTGSLPNLQFVYYKNLNTDTASIDISAGNASTNPFSNLGAGEFILMPSSGSLNYFGLAKLGTASIQIVGIPL